MTAGPDRACPHEDFAAEVDVNRLLDGQAGLRPDRPMVSVDETELRAPLRPASSDPDFGLGIPGFAVTMREG